jgi:hypothetical protein
MNEEKLKQILNKIGQTEVPADIARIAEQTSQRFTAALNLLPNHRQPVFFSPLRLLAAAAVIAVAFVAGRWSTPLSTTSPSPNAIAYIAATPAYPTTQKNENSFWQQKAIAAMQPRPYAQSANVTSQLNAYKQYLKEKHYE